jgi:O-antigen ligase
VGVLTIADAAPEARARSLWRLTPVRVALAVVPVWVTAASLLFNIGWSTKLVIAATLAIALAAPVEALLLVAAVAPLGQLVAALIHDENFRIGEAMVVAFLLGVLLRSIPESRGPRTPLPAVAWLFACAILASTASLAWQLRATPAAMNALRHLFYMYYYPSENPLGVIDTARFAEGLALVAATVMLLRQRPRLAVMLPAALVASATAAALSSVLLWRHIGVASALARQVRNDYRIAGHLADPNAAGSYFGLIVFLAAGMAIRARGAARLPWIAATLLIAVGLWFSESLSAFGAVALVAAIALAATLAARLSPGARASVVGVVVAAVVVAAALGAQRFEASRTARDMELRKQFTATSLRMIAARPLLGVGVGQYATVSPLFLSPRLAWTYGAENAHDYFLQVAAEAGLVGFALFIVWVGAGIGRALRALATTPYDAPLLGATAGVIAFLITCATGHPLLVGEATYPFWLQFGLMAALAGSTLLNAGSNVDAVPQPAEPGRRRLAVAAGVAIAGCGAINAARGPVTLAHGDAIDGFYEWQTADDGVRFRWTKEYASVIVPKDVDRVRIPIRVPTDRPTIAPMPVSIAIAGSKPTGILVDRFWSVFEADLTTQSPLAPVKRVNLKVERTWQPALYVAGSTEMRPVGVQVGECELVRQP